MLTTLFAPLTSSSCSAFGCSCPNDLPDDAAIDAGADVNANDSGVAQDAPSPFDTGPSDTGPLDTGPLTPGCVGEPVMNESGALSGTAFGRAFSLSFITGGIETTFCPRVFIRAGSTDDFSGFEFTRPYFELDVPYQHGATSPGLTTGTLTWFFDGDEPMSEEVMVNITRADGLFENELPESERRIEFSLSHHDATTDFDAEANIATYCNNFPMCAIDMDCTP